MKIIFEIKYIKYLFFIAIIFIVACNTDYVPKPHGYFRIDVPQKVYRHLDSIYPFTFDYPVYANIKPDALSPDEIYWINVEFPQFKGILHLSYKTINGNLQQYLEDSRKMVYKHIPKASAINNRIIYNKKTNVFGLMYEINGIGAASPCQFYLTDSIQHFIRGALYFNIKPNNDSLAPIITFIKQDIEQLINSFEWKEQ